MAAGSIEPGYILNPIRQMPDLGRIPGMAEHALPMKNLGDVLFLRNHLLHRLEQAALVCDANERR